MKKRTLLLIGLILLLAALSLAACGGKQAAQPTQAPAATTAPANTPVPPAATKAPTNTPVPPTATPAPTKAPEAAGKGDPAKGEELFKAQTLHGNPGCNTCHSLKPGEKLVGPSMAGIATDAAGDAADEGISTEDMLKEMICDPNAEIAAGFPKDVMPQDWCDKLTPQELHDIIAFLMTLKEEGGSEQGMAGDPAAGEELFKSQTIAGNPGCITCHSLKPGEKLVGPSMAGIATDAAGDAADEGISTEDMLKEMICDPNAEIAAGFPKDVMPQDWCDKLTPKQLSDVIAFLMTLKEEGGSEQGMAGDPAKGEELFKAQTLHGNPGCNTCHSLKPGEKLVGPSMAGIATDAAGDAADEGISTEDMLKEMICDPNAEIAAGFPKDVMPQDWCDKLTPDELHDIIAFLMTLKEEGGSEQSMAGDPAAGEELFKSQTIAGNPGCITCHSLKPGEKLVGPSMAGIATDAAGDAADEGISTEDMLKEMICDPNAEIAAGFPKDVMPQDWCDKLTPEELHDIIAFLMTLKEE